MLFLHDVKHVMFASLARTLLIPVFMLCNTTFTNTANSAHVPFINSDIVYFVILFLFGATNGSVLPLPWKARTEDTDTYLPPPFF